MTRAEKEGEGKGEGKGERKREREKKRQRERRKHRHGPPTLMLLREPLSRSQSVACAKVQAGAFKALASLAPAKKKNVRRLDSLVRVSRRVERDQKKRVHVSWSSQAVLKMAAFGAHARQASAEVWRTWRPCEELDFALFQKRLGSPAGV